MEPSKKQKLLAPRLAIYELEWFFCLLRYVRKSVAEEKAHGLTWNCAFEGLHLHARNLLDFFRQKTKERDDHTRNDDVISEDFGFPNCQLDDGGALHKRISKKLTHLTYTRFDEDYQKLDLCVFDPLENLCMEFLASP